MTLHESALVFLSERLNGKINHAGLPYRSDYTINGCAPDIVVEKNPKTMAYHLDLHEVEAVNLTRGRIERWDNIPLKHKKTLWLVLPEGTAEAFQRIRVIQKSRFDFEPVSTLRVHKEVFWEAS